jgi:hypothetical protein
MAVKLGWFLLMPFLVADVTDNQWLAALSTPDSLPRVEDHYPLALVQRTRILKEMTTLPEAMMAPGFRQAIAPSAWPVAPSVEGQRAPVVSSNRLYEFKALLL